MRHDGRPRCAVPVHLSRWDVDHVSDLKLLGLVAFGADEAGAKGDSQDLAPLVPVPESARAGGEADVVAHAVRGFEDRVHVYLAGEGFAWGPGLGAHLMGGADELHDGGWKESVEGRKMVREGGQK